MEAKVITGAVPVAHRAARPLLVALPPRRGFASFSVFGGGGGRFFGGGGGRGGGGGGDESGAGAGAAAALAGAVGEAGTADGDGDVVVLLHVGGMSCGGCAATVKRILESQPEVASATVDLDNGTATVWATPEAMAAARDWRKQLGEKLANHLSSCGFQSRLHDEAQAEAEAESEQQQQS